MDFNTGPGSGGSSSRSGGPSRSGGAGEEFNLQDPVGSFVRTVVAVVTQPVPFFRGIAWQGNFVNPLIFAIICALISALLSGILAVIFPPLFASPQNTGESFVGGIGVLVGTLILSPIFTAIGLVIAAGIIHLLVLLFVKPRNTGFEATFRIASYTQVTQLVSWIPIIGSIIAAIWAIVLYIFGIREVHGTTTGKAALVVLIPVAILLVLFVIVGGALLVFFLGNQQQF
ncbi:MAG: hypothetical protein AVDCRST_MAG37-1934 [uncultured Rubrobacteraceae bacterium]|uniref:Yip1 domain-containing protein n=1 Tax=uncultured Rubrobacteraceae bacterium TaxID=349277 RepID=A0A6J4QK30_9ACTN|nr:MAG: hypothetical protein AVDCRST_MAG37-1934 [uncultured Rubrobacteraceae bacterium]